MSIPQKQRSPQWFEWRRDKIGASEAAIIQGCGFKSPGELLEEKLGLRKPEDPNAAMERGIALEDKARCAFENEVGFVVFDQVLTHPEYDWMIASMDGLTMEGDKAVEIKCVGYKTHVKTRLNGVPEYYYPQLQHQMAVCGLQEIYYYSYCKIDELNPAQTYLEIVKRDDDYIEKLIENELAFMAILDEGWRIITYYEDMLDTLKTKLYERYHKTEENGQT